MQIQKISFTSNQTQEQPKKNPSLYSKKGYMTLVRASQFTEGFLGGYAILETIDKFTLLKNKNNLPLKALKEKAVKHTKYNLLLGIAAGIACAFIGKFVTDKYTIPMTEKISDWAEKQEQTTQKTKELLKKENNEKSADVKTEKEEKHKEVKQEEAQPEPQKSERTEPEEAKIEDKKQ